jgi:hypothetical protein
MNCIGLDHRPGEAACSDNGLESTERGFGGIDPKKNLL